MSVFSQVAEKESERLRLEQDVNRLEAMLRGTATQDVTTSPDTDMVDTDSGLQSVCLFPMGDSTTSLPTIDSRTHLTSTDRVTSSLSSDCASPLQLVSALQTQLQTEFDTKLAELQRTTVDSDQLEAAVTVLQTQYQVCHHCCDSPTDTVPGMSSLL